MTLEVRGLSARVRGGGPPVLRAVSLRVEAGEALGLVGESGAGKSMVGRAVLGILPRAVEVTAGEVFLDGVDLLRLPEAERRARVGRICALIPQDPLSALNPSRRVGRQVVDPLVEVLGWDRARAEARAREAFEEVRLPDPGRVLRAYPHELSGGQRQRVLIAAAFAASPRLVVADEPTTALDVTVQRGIVGLIREMQARRGTALLFVTHDLGIASKVCARIAVLYAGLVVEESDARAFFRGPVHPYARALLEASPRPDAPGALRPVPEAVVRAVRAEAAAFDRTVRHG